MFLLWTVGLALAATGKPWLFVGALLILVGLLIGVVGGVLTMTRPPSWLKPRWLRESERRG
jgi:hypothetical protein